MIRRVKPVFLAGIGTELFVWFLALRHTINNWTFALVTGALVVLLPRVAAAANPSAYGRARSVGDEHPATALELVGVDRAFTADELRAINRGLGLEGLPA
jgi:hypothetical protein